MLNHLTKYLLQYRRISIPHVGTIQIVQHPAQLNVVDKLILPPTFTLELGKEEDVPEHQLTFLATVLNKGKGEIINDLRFFGDKLQEKINGTGFEWSGLGTISRSTQSLPLSMQALEAVPAERVLRRDARHQVLVGDQQVTSGKPAEIESGSVIQENKRSVFVIIGWILLVLSILFIAFYLYQSKFRINATGSRQSPTSCFILERETLKL